MAKEIPIIIENKLTQGEREINIFHHSRLSTHIISHNSTITLSLGGPGDNDYLHISVLRGPGYFWKYCAIDLPSWLNYHFSSIGKLTVTHNGGSQRSLLEIPPGPPTWELKITRPAGLAGAGGQENIVISDSSTGKK
jgi:hypothetical protein